MKKPELLVPVAIWEFVTAAAILIPASVMIAVFFANALDWGMWMGGWDVPAVIPVVSAVMVFVILLFIAYCVLAVLGGVWLLQGREMGRVLSIVHAVLSLLCVPVGTVIGALILVYLTRPEVKEYFLTTS